MMNSAAQFFRSLSFVNSSLALRFTFLSSPLSKHTGHSFTHCTTNVQKISTGPRKELSHFTRIFSPLNVNMSTTTTSRVTSGDADYTLYFAPTPNGKKPALALEEMGVSYKVVPIHIGKNDQFTSEYKAINPNSKIPALIDHTASDLAVFESGAILEYLAEKTGKFAPAPDNVAERYNVKQWLYWQMAGFGPMLGQMGYFWKYCKEDVPVGKERYLKEAIRLFTVLDTQLAKSRFIAGDEYSIADMATYFWSFAPSTYHVKEQFREFEHVKRWQDEISKRPAVQAVNAIPFEW